jgi:hypothetical protein
MKTLVTFFLCGLAIASSAQTSLAQNTPAQTTLKTFTSSAGLFRFKYSDMLVDCTPQGSAIPDACITQGAICDGPGSEGSALACFAYPRERFKDKPRFVAASFFVSEIHSATTEQACLKGSPDWFVISTKAETTIINHVVFQTFEIGDNWAGGGQSGPAYRTFHNGTCYELGIQTVMSRAEYDPGTFQEFTRQDSSDVEGRLKQALNSFLFLK